MKKIFKIVLIGVILLLVLGYGAIIWHTNSILKEMADVRVVKESKLIQTYQDEINQVQFTNKDGLKLNAWQFKVEAPKGVVIVLHGLHGMDASSLLDYGKFFKDAGYAAFSLDMRAHGLSEGNRIAFGYEETKDVEALLDWIDGQSQYVGVERILYGLSMGGSTAINTAAKRYGVAKVVSVSAFESFEAQVLDYMRGSGIPEMIVQLYKPAFRLLLLARHKVNPVKNAPIYSIAEMRMTKVLLIHGTEDSQTLVRQAYNLKKANQRTELWVIDGADHLIVDDILAEENAWYRERVLAFLEK